MDGVARRNLRQGREGEESLPIEIPGGDGNQGYRVHFTRTRGEDFPGNTNEMAMRHDADEAQVYRHCERTVKRLDLIGRDEEGLPEGPGPHDARGHLPINRPIGQKHIDFSLVALFNRTGPIVHLYEQVAVRRNHPTNAFRVHHGLGARDPSTEEILISFKAEVTETLVTRRRVCSIQSIRNALDVHTENRVVCNRPIPRAHLQ